MQTRAKKSAAKPKGARAGGRPHGSGGVAQRVRDRVIAQAEVKPLEVLLETMAYNWQAAKNAKTNKTRERWQDKACAVAVQAAPYFHPRLQATTIKGEEGKPLAFVLALPSADTLKQAIRGTEAPTSLDMGDCKVLNEKVILP